MRQGSRQFLLFRKEWGEGYALVSLFRENVTHVSVPGAIVAFQKPVRRRFAGSGDLVASGNARNARISIAGSGAIEARGLRLGNASLTIAGSGDARLSANGRVSANITGSGSAEVVGTTDCQQTRTGSDRLTCSA